MIAQLADIAAECLTIQDRRRAQYATARNAADEKWETRGAELHTETSTRCKEIRQHLAKALGNENLSLIVPAVNAAEQAINALMLCPSLPIQNVIPYEDETGERGIIYSYAGASSFEKQDQLRGLYRAALIAIDAIRPLMELADAERDEPAPSRHKRSSAKANATKLFIELRETMTDKEALAKVNKDLNEEYDIETLRKYARVHEKEKSRIK